ncbi:hypothetical protein KP509_27G044700 [Ceratopteris richardii]|uniref:Uncharacterized protein n=1 Tax=Ceratopteris richardii TaxID=49495 RepID=A0A8T2RG49_CERRI|nr:hypothetical protein KP509_27G044700 [Ceratopteris richardii]
MIYSDMVTGRILPNDLSACLDQGQSPCNYAAASDGCKRLDQKLRDSGLQLGSEDLKEIRKSLCDVPKQQNGIQAALVQEDPLVFRRDLDSISSSLSLLTNTLEMAMKQDNVNSKVSNLTCKEPQGSPLHKVKSSEHGNSLKGRGSPAKFQDQASVLKNKPMKGPLEAAMAMTTKAKLVLRELKCVKQELLFSNERCAQLEEENRSLRESIDKGVREEDDLVRLQLETLLAEKARLMQENATFARENQFLHEVVQYHQLKLRELAVCDESPTFMDEELEFSAEGETMDLMTMYSSDEHAIHSCDVEGDTSAWEGATSFPSHEVEVSDNVSL